MKQSIIRHMDDQRDGRPMREQSVAQKGDEMDRNRAKLAQKGNEMDRIRDKVGAEVE